jgi:hypothetical protein
VGVTGPSSPGVTGPAGLTGSQGLTGLAIAQAKINLHYHYDATVPVYGTQYLRNGRDVVTSSAGDRISKNSNLTALTVQLDQVDSSRSYKLEIMTESSLTGSVLNYVTIPTDTLGVHDTGITGAVSAGTEIGARLVRDSGSGESTFHNIIVNAVFTED